MKNFITIIFGFNILIYMNNNKKNNKMEQKVKYIDNLINELLQKKEISFNEKKILDKDDQMKLEIIKLICHKTGKLCIENKNISHYSEKLEDAVVIFLQKLRSLKLKNIFTIYEPEFYSDIKNLKIFQIYLSLTKKELIPFFLMVGFYSYINLQKNNIKEINEIQSNDYFEEMTNIYINVKNIAFPQIIHHYRKYILDTLKFPQEEEEDEDKKFSEEEYKWTFNGFLIYNELYIKGELFDLVNSIFSAITENGNSLYLEEGKEYSIVNSLIDCLLNNIYETIQSGFYEEFEIQDLIKKLYKNIQEYLGFSIEFNYISFVDAYCKEFKKEKANDKLFLVCTFFRGLNANNFTETFKGLNFSEGKNHYKNIDKLYEQIKLKNKNVPEKKSETCNVKIKDNNERENANNKTSKLDSELSEIKCHVGKKDETSMISNNETKGSEKYGTDEIHDENIEGINNIIIKKENSDKNNISANQDDKFKKTNNEDNKNKIKNKQDIVSCKEMDIKALSEKISRLESENSNLKKKFKNSEKNWEIKFKESQKNVKELEKNFNNFKLQASSTNSMMINKIKNQNEEIVELKKEMKLIKFRDINKVIINNYISKYSKEVSSIYNKKDKAYSISKLLKGKEKFYFDKVIDKYYHSNEVSHFTGLIAEYKKNNDEENIAQEIIKDYLVNMFGIEQNENYKKTKEYLVNLFGLNYIISDLYKQKKYFYF